MGRTTTKAVLDRMPLGTPSVVPDAQTLPDSPVQEPETGHWLIYGESGAGKSTSASTFPGPLLVFAFDPSDKLKPYLRLGTRVERHTDPLTGGVTAQVFSETAHMATIEYYGDRDPLRPTAYAQFLDRLTELDHAGLMDVGTLILDSITFCELAARKWAQYTLNPNAKDPRQWYGASTEQLEELVMMRLASIHECNVVVIAHVDEDKDELHGAYVRNPAFPGRLRKRVAAGFGEMYRAYARVGDGGVREYLWQTRMDNSWNASTQIDAPDPCAARWEALW